MRNGFKKGLKDAISAIDKVIAESSEITRHFNNERSDRESFIEEKIEKGYVLYSFLVDKGHRDGKEIHTIYSNGVIEIENARTHRLITKLIARPAQLLRYKNGWYGYVEKAYDKYGKEIPLSTVYIPEQTMRLAKSALRNGYNLR